MKVKEFENAGIRYFVTAKTIKYHKDDHNKVLRVLSGSSLGTVNILIGYIDPEQKEEFVKKYGHLSNIDDGNHAEIEAEAEGTYIPSVPSKTTGPADSWAPAEGGYIEDLVLTINGEEINDYLTEDGFNKIQEMLSEE